MRVRLTIVLPLLFALVPLASDPGPTVAQSEPRYPAQLRPHASDMAPSAPDRAPDQSCDPRPVTPIGTDFFTDISEQSGIRDENFDPDPPDEMRINDHSRLAFADLNGDGYDDIVAHNLFPNPQNGVPFEHLVYHSNGDGTFEHVSDASGLRDVQAGFFAFGDVDNDGDQDAFAGLDVPLDGEGHQLLLNDGDGHFTPLPDAGVDVPFRNANGDILHLTGNALFVDVDGDGNLDLFLGNGHTSSVPPDQLFMGNGDGTFEHASDRLRDDIGRPSNGSVACDYDSDGDLDIFVSVYGVSHERGHNVLWENDGTGHFDDVAVERGWAALPTGNYFLEETDFGTAIEPDREPGSYMGGNGFGLACADVNGDGHLDIFQTNISHPNPSDYSRKWSDPSTLMINLGPEEDYRFENQWLARDLPFNEGDVDGGAVDVDNDGQFDLSLSRDKKYEGRYDDPAQKSWFGLMHQLEDGTFADVGRVSGINDMENDPPELNRMKAAQNHAWSDIDHDGDLDLLVGGRTGGKSGRPNFLFRNDIGSQNDWLALQLEGDGQAVNRDAIGARVTLTLGDGTIAVQEVQNSRGMYNSIDTRVLHFGLGERCIEAVTVRWPDGTRETLDPTDVGRNQFATIRYGEGAPAPTATAGPTDTPEPTPTPQPTATSTPVPAPPAVYLPRLYLDGS